jgi:16S rRNA (cytidine1402-2'-O)-methyltransferase
MVINSKFIIRCLLSDYNTLFSKPEAIPRSFSKLQFLKPIILAKGKLYLIPAPLGDDAINTIPAYVIERLHKLDYFIAERAKTARRFIKETNPIKPFSELHFFELNKHTLPDEINTFLNPAKEGHDIGLLSEAGCPGVADPGAEIVKIAHKNDIEVVPFVGPSSILLALMASGMNGQSFAFQGYLSPKPIELANDLKKMEQQSAKYKQTQIFIETPYRNNKFIEQAIKTLSPSTRFCIAANLTLDSQFIKTRTIKNWKSLKAPDLHKVPAIFLIQA